ncbi:alpha/beta hydrolase family protein [Fulvivirga lutea]|uniref:Prolyl oligopeptidase family serine peptidase n=1 Tax=Fulvivirga lutea TaxID=2810512 RepID=A0A974WIZ8_9BACT|nr:lipase family protein [Fulvivirga lutea]QSE98633.1 prolyl oligopeptidase family serine peptidase [Fulvivirga lutea]
MKYEKIARYLSAVLLLLFTLVLSSCDNSDDETQPEPQIENLEDGTRLTEISIANLSGLIGLFGIPELSDLADQLNYDIVGYEVTYTTTYLGEEITASGLVTFPETTDPVPMLSFQNGTIASNDEAPTNNQSEFFTFSAIASTGYIFVIPDYIGFGASSEYISPYHHAEYTGRAVIDLMKAAKELAVQEGYNFNGKAFLAGYSEGGYAAMASHKLMEEEQPEGFELIASAPASGGYDVKGFQEYLFGLETYDNPYFLAFVALSYKTTYGYDDPLSDLFQEPYATIIPDLFDGSNSGSRINGQLTTVIADLIQPDILANIEDPRYSDFVNALNDNSLVNWQPQAPMFMYHGTADVTVPYQNSVDTYDKLIANGANPESIQLIDLVGEDHNSGVAPYALAMLSVFNELK